MKEDRISLCLFELNKERINIQSDLNYLRNSAFKKKVKALLSFIKSGDFKYIFSKIRRRKEKITHPTNTARLLQDNDRIAIYTVIFGDYDIIQDPMYITPNTDYFILSNQKNIISSIWKTIDINRFKKEIKGFDNLSCARFFKTHPHLLFPEHRYSIFIDGNIQAITDMRPVIQMLGNNFIAIHQQPGRDCIYEEADAVIALKKANPQTVHSQTEKYKREGFPSHFGLFQTNVLVREHNLPQCIKIMEEWWTEISTHSKRDQLSFTYVLWKNNLDSTAVSLLGPNTALNPRFRVIKHKQK